jgi:hypothetical protein
MPMLLGRDTRGAAGELMLLTACHLVASTDGAAALQML